MTSSCSSSTLFSQPVAMGDRPQSDRRALDEQRKCNTAGRRCKIGARTSSRRAAQCHREVNKNASSKISPKKIASTGHLLLLFSTSTCINTQKSFVSAELVKAGNPMYTLQSPEKQTMTNLIDCFTDDEQHLADSEWCLETVYQASKSSPGIEDLVIGVNETMLTCKVTGGEKVQKRGCEAMTTLSFDLISMALGYMILCGSDDDKYQQNVVSVYGDAIGCGPFLNVVANNIRSRMEKAEERFYLSPLRWYVSEQVMRYRKTYVEGLLEKQEASPGNLIPPSSFWRLSVNVVNDISQWVRWNAWQVNHFLWVQDVIEASQVVHTTWGNARRWDSLGAHDANNTYNLTGPKPRFFFSEKFGMRWEIVNGLLEEYGLEELRVVEVGVFAGHFSKFLLEKFPKMQLIGIDPYIGTDETFPGDYSQTLDPAVAYGNALSIYEESGPGRATLWATTSLEAVKNVPDQSIHAVFVDGCHFYNCVEEDLRLWLPKIVPGGLVLGHDFSPQWPGVVRAVWEMRPNKRVFLAMDWMYWWQVDEDDVNVLEEIYKKKENGTASLTGEL